MFTTSSHVNEPSKCFNYIFNSKPFSIIPTKFKGDLQTISWIIRHMASVTNDVQSFPSTVLKFSLAPIQLTNTYATWEPCAYNGTSPCTVFTHPQLQP